MGWDDMIKGIRQVVVCGAFLVSLAGCGGGGTSVADKVPGLQTTSGQDAAEPTVTTAHEPTANVLDGRDPCSLIDHSTIGRITDTKIKTAEPASGGADVGCSFNSAESGVTTDFHVYSAATFGKADAFPGRSDRTQEAAQVPGAENAWVSRASSHGQPEVEVCGTIGQVVACAYTTAFLNRTTTELESMANQLAALLAKAV